MGWTGRYNLVDCNELESLCPLQKKDLQRSGSCFLVKMWTRQYSIGREVRNPLFSLNIKSQWNVIYWRLKSLKIEIHWDWNLIQIIGQYINQTKYSSMDYQHPVLNRCLDLVYKWQTCCNRKCAKLFNWILIFFNTS